MTTQVKVTLKASGDRDAPWIVFEGGVEEVRQDLVALAGLTDAEFEDGGVPLTTAVAEASNIFQVKEQLKQTLGATPLGSDAAVARQDAAPGAPAPVAEKPKVTVESVVAEVGAATSTRELGDIWKDRQGDLTDAEKDQVREALNARSTELKNK